MSRRRKVWAVIALLIAVAAIAPYTTPFLLLLVSRILILAILAMSVDLLLGFTGLSSGSCWGWRPRPCSASSHCAPAGSIF